MKMTLALFIATVLSIQPVYAQNHELLPLLRFAAGFLNEGVFPESSLYTTDDDIVITANDGVELQANIFVPTGLTQPAPAIVLIHSWGLNEYQYLDQAAVLAEKGYIVLSYSTRGFGQSGGLIDTAGPLDTADFSTIIDFLISNYNVDVDAIGTGGISYGAGISFIGAAKDSRVKVVAAMSCWGDLFESLYGQQTPRLVWGEILTSLSEFKGRPDPIIEQHWNSIKFQNLSEIPVVREWTKERSPINYVDQLNKNGTAVYFAKAYGDNLFQPNSLLELFSRLTTPKYIDLVSGTHGSAELLPALLNVGPDLIWENTFAWFDWHLRGITSDISYRQPVQMQVEFADYTDSFDNYPINSTVVKNYHLHPRKLFDTGDLESTPFNRSRSTDNQINTWADTGFTNQIPVLSGILAQVGIPVLTNVNFVSKFRSIYFETQRIEKPMKIRGIPSVSVSVRTSEASLQLVTYLYDMDQYDTARLITHGAITLPQAPRNETIQLNLKLVGTAYDIPAGHRLVLAIDTKDPVYKSVTNANFYVDFEFNKDLTNVLHVPTVD